MSKLRLLKVIVQPVFVVDDGETLTETPAQPVSVSPTEWPTYATTGFIEALTQLEAQLAQTPEPPKPNNDNKGTRKQNNAGDHNA